MRKVFGISTIVFLLMGTHAFAQRTLTMTVELNGRPVLRTHYEDKGTATPVEIWRNLLSQPPLAEPELNEINPDPDDPQFATLKGPVVVRVEQDKDLIGRAEVENLALRRSNTTNFKWYLDTDDVFRTAFAAKLSDFYSSENYFKRIRDPFVWSSPLESDSAKDKSYDGLTWLFILIPILIVGAVFIGWMYVRDMRSIRWYYAVPLGLMRATVYGLLAYMFLLPTIKETRIWKPRIPPEIIRHSRVVLLLDVSGSMAETKDDPSSVPETNRKTRLEKVIECLSDEKVAFFRKLLEKNPVYVYRFASRLDNEATPFQIKDGVIRPFTNRRKKDSPGQEEEVPLTPWKQSDWMDFAKYADFRRLIYRGLSEEGQKAVRKDFGEKETGPGSIEWVQGYLADKVDTHLGRLKLSEEDAATFRANINSLEGRLALARTITLSSNITDSVQTAFDAEKENMLQSIIVFSDGRSNIGVDAADAAGKGVAKLNSAWENLHRAAKQTKIPIITIGIGEIRIIKSIRITDLQAPSRAPPDDAFKINVEIDGEKLPGETVDVFLQLYPPESETPLVMPGKVTFDRSEPPHGQFEWTIDPPEIIKMLIEAGMNVTSNKELPEGQWKARAYTAKITEEGKPIPMQRVESELVPIKIEKKPVRLLLMGSVANRDFQFLLTQLIRDKADVSVFLQNEAGQFHDGKSITFLDDNHRQLNRFPEPAYFHIGDNPDEKDDTKWLNLARYDVIIAFDPDWTQLTLEQTEMVRNWVDLYAGGLLHVAGRVHTPKLAENPTNYDGRTAPILEILPVTPADYTFKVGAAIDRKSPRRLEFPGAAPEMEFLRLDDSKPEEVVSGWEQFFTGAQTRELGINAQLKRGFYDYYPVKDVKAGAAIVARYMEPQVSENTFDKKEPPFIVTYKYGQGMTAFLGSSEMWRLRQAKDVYFERFWVKMSRFLASGSRKQQNRRGRILMSKNFMQGDVLRSTVEILGADLKGLSSSANPEITVKPVELENYELPQKKGVELTAKERDEYLKSLTRILKLAPRKGGKKDDGYFQLQYLLAAKDFPPGVWRVEVKIPSSSDIMTEKFMVRKAPSLELADVRPDMLALAAISSEVDEPSIKEKLNKKPEVLEKLRAHSFSAPSLQGQRLAFKFDDKQSLELIPEAISKSEPQRISNPQTEPEVRRSKIEPRWFSGPTLPHWMTRWYDNWMGTPEKSHQVGLWMLVCVALLSMEWLTRKLLKLA